MQETQALDVGALPPAARLAVIELRDLAGFEAGPVAAMLAWQASLVQRSLDVVSVVVPRVLPGRDVVTADRNDKVARDCETVGRS